MKGYTPEQLISWAIDCTWFCFMSGGWNGVLNELSKHLAGLEAEWHFCGELAIDVYEISFLAPEITLFYKKSRNSENVDYQHDYDMVINALDKERHDWFVNAMRIEYPNGHKWINPQLC